MESLYTDINTESNIACQQWVIELTDLGTHQVYMGYNLSESYLVIGISAPDLEEQISINSIPKEPFDEIVVPLELQNASPLISGEINFRCSKAILEKWDIYFFDNRFDYKTPVKPNDPIRIGTQIRSTRSEKLRLMGYVRKKQNTSVFELRFKPKL